MKPTKWILIITIFIQDKTTELISSSKCIGICPDFWYIDVLSPVFILCRYSANNDSSVILVANNGINLFFALLLSAIYSVDFILFTFSPRNSFKKFLLLFIVSASKIMYSSFPLTTNRENLIWVFLVPMSCLSKIPTVSSLEPSSSEICP